MSASICCRLLLVAALCASVYAQQRAPRPTNAYCSFSPSHDTTRASGLSGFMSFQTIQNSAQLVVQYQVCGLVAGGVYTPAVNQFGNIFTLDASSTGNTFAPFTISPLTAGSDGCTTSGLLSEATLALFGSSSIIGRSVVLKSNSLSGAIVAQCVVGRNDDAAVEAVAPFVNDLPTVNRARCDFEVTKSSATPNIQGFITFDDMGSFVAVNYFVGGVGVDGAYPVGVYQKGTISDKTGATAVGPLFVGQCSNCRGVGQGQQVGNLAGGTHPFIVKNQTTGGYFTDNVIKLNGNNSIIGRAVLLLDASVLVPIAQCVIGVDSYGVYTPPASTGTVPVVTVATALMNGVQPNPTIVNPIGTPRGYFRFSIDSGSTNGLVRVEYLLFNLPPGPHAFHVHNWGNLCNNDGTSAGGHFVGVCNQCRPGPLQEIGLLNNGTALVADSFGVAKGAFYDIVALNGQNSIIGRSVIIHNNGTVGNTVYIAQGVIGRSRETTAVLGPDMPTVFSAGCRLRSTFLNPLYPNVDGYVLFELTVDNKVMVKWNARGIPPGNHTWHIHATGDIISDDDGAATLGHFLGQPLPGRPTGLNEVGAIDNSRVVYADDYGQFRGVFTDDFITLNGIYSIIGRSIIIHGDGSYTGRANRVAQCVIGNIAQTNTPQTCNSLLPQNDLFTKTIGSAFCTLEATTTNARPVTGNVSFTTSSVNGPVTVSYTVCGLDAGNHGWHVHVLGDIWARDGSSVLGHYIGVQCNGTVCRQSATLQEVGLINNGIPVNVPTTGACVSGTVSDTLLRLNGLDSMIGRSVIFHGLTGNSAARVAQCVIGRNDDATTENAAVVAADRPLVRRAGCMLRSTSNAANPTMGGFVMFETNVTDPNFPNNGVDVSYYVFNADRSTSLQIHVHQKGNVADTDKALATAGHFVGECNNCRPGAPLQEIGLLGNGYLIDTSASASVSGFFTDSVIRLNGIASIIGRSVVIHKAAADGGARIAQCVIGVLDENLPLPLPTVTGGTVPYVYRANAVLKPSSLQNSQASGTVFFEQMRDTGLIRARYFISNLAPGDHTWDIHQLGNLCRNNTGNLGDTFTGVCVNISNCRPGQNLFNQKVGFLGNRAPIKADANGLAQGELVDNLIAFNDTNGILGRSVVVYATTAGTSPIVAFGAIGREKETTAQLMRDVPTVAHASCKFTSTNKSPGRTVTGFVSISAQVEAGGVYIKYKVNGLNPGSSNPWHVHVYGNILGEDAALSETGHFVGTLQNPRPQGVLQEVGMLNDGIPIVASSTGEAYGFFQDLNVRLNGPNSIVGRAIVIHDPVTPANRIAHCVVGIASESTGSPFPDCPDLPVEPPTARCVLRSTPASPTKVTGNFDIVKIALGSPAQITFSVCGLSTGTHYFGVTQLGDQWNPDGTSMGSIWPGFCNNCRPTLTPPDNSRVGWLGDKFGIVVGASGCASGSFYDNIITLTHNNSIVGRGLVVYAANTDPDPTKVMAQCVIGRSDQQSVEVVVPGKPFVKKAICNFDTTVNAPTLAGGGWMTYEDLGSAGVEIRWYIYGLPEGRHQFHVHVKGDMSSNDASAVLEHFQGNCNSTYPCRPFGLQEVGNIGNGYEMYAKNLIASGYLIDPVVKLNGLNSIIGRSTVVHGNGPFAAPRVAQCVIGVLEDSETPVTPAFSPAPPAGSPPQILTAGCYFRNTPNIASDVVGYVEFSYVPGDLTTLQTNYLINGMAPGSYLWTINSYGNQCNGDGSDLSSVFTGTCTNCRPTLPPSGQKVGYINNANFLSFNSNQVAQGRFTENVIKLHGDNSIIGRSIIIYNGTTETSPKAAVCVVGIIKEHSFQLQPDHPAASQAVCKLQPTFIISPPDQPVDIEGFMSFTQASQSDTKLSVSYRATKLPATMTHPIYVYRAGDLLSRDNGLSTKSIFIGNPGFRPPGCPLQVGPIGGCQAPLATKYGTIFGSFSESSARFTGENSILGRSIVLTGTADDGSARIAYCVVARSNDNFNVANTQCPLLAFKPDPVEASTSDDNKNTIIIAVCASVGGLIALAILFYFISRPSPASKGYQDQHKLAAQQESTTAIEMRPSAPASAGSSAALVTTTPAAAGAGEGLPNGWEQFEDDDGHTYFHNSVTGLSQWERPTK